MCYSKRLKTEIQRFQAAPQAQRLLRDLRHALKGLHMPQTSWKDSERVYIRIFLYSTRLLKLLLTSNKQTKIKLTYHQPNQHQPLKRLPQGKGTACQIEWHFNLLTWFVGPNFVIFNAVFFIYFLNHSEKLKYNHTIRFRYNIPVP